jgi:hypothetical protein
LNLASNVTEEEGRPEIRENNIVIRRYTEIGAVKGYGKLSVEAREGVVLDARHVQYFVKLTAETADQYPRYGHGSIQIDALPRFLEALDRLSSASIDRNKFAFTEIEFNHEDIKIVVFNNHTGKIMTTVDAAGVSVTFPDLSALSELKRLIQKAKTHLETHRMDG